MWTHAFGSLHCSQIFIYRPTTAIVALVAIFPPSSSLAPETFNVCGALSIGYCPKLRNTPGERCASLCDGFGLADGATLGYSQRARCARGSGRRGSIGGFA